MRPNCSNSPLRRRATGCNLPKISAVWRMPAAENNQGAAPCTEPSNSPAMPARKPRGSGPMRHRWQTSIPAIPNCSRPIPSGRISTGCAGKSRCITARTACSGRIGRSPNTTTSWTSRPTMRCSRRRPISAASPSATPRPICAAKASSPWTSRVIGASARPWRRCSRRPISTSSRSTSASDRPNASTICREAKCSTGSTGSRSN